MSAVKMISTRIRRRQHINKKGLRMNNNMWCTEQDYLDYCFKSTGQNITDLDENYFVRGDRPPPRYIAPEEDDIETTLRFGNHKYSHKDEGFKPPDLNGITNMLRMAKTFDKPKEDLTSCKLVEKSTEQKIIISKLDPNVKEFVPSSAVTKPDDDKILGAGDNNDDKIKKAAELKDKIASAATVGKRQKNVAIAALIKLNTTSTTKPTPLQPEHTPDQNRPTERVPLNGEPASSSSPKPILFTPDYFAGPSAQVNITVNNDSALDTSEKLLTSPKPNSPAQILDPYVKESIEKVNNWFEGPERKAKAPLGLHIGPVTFRKKGAPVSPLPELPRNPATVSSASATPSYVPSEYASELAKQYKDSVKEKRRKAEEQQLAQDRTMSGLLHLKVAQALRDKEENVRNGGKSPGSKSSKGSNF